MKRVWMQVLLLVTAIVAVPAAHASLIVLTATLSGANENPPNASPGTGFAEVDVDTVLNTMLVRASFSGLTGTTTSSHIHCCAVPPTNSLVATVPPAFPGFPLGVTSGSFVTTLDLTSLSSYNPPFVAANGGTAASAEAVLIAGLVAGNAYFNIHTTTFGGGELRGFLRAVPEPWTPALMVSGLALIAGSSRRRSRRAATGRASS